MRGRESNGKLHAAPGERLTDDANGVYGKSLVSLIIDMMVRVGSIVLQGSEQ
jgi:hypothetical protein